MKFVKKMKQVKMIVAEFNKCIWVPGELKSVLGYKGTLVSLRLLRTGVSLRLPRYSGQL